MRRVRVFADLEAVSEAASAIARQSIHESLDAGRDPAVVLSGGRTPRTTFSLLARGILEDGVPVERFQWLFGDERWVAPGHPRSNEGMARETLLRPIGAPEKTIASWQADAGDPVEAADRYRVRIAAVAAAGGPDLLLLGMGADGHTASLFPGSSAHLPGRAPMEVSADLPGDTAAVYLSEGREWRLTLCPRFLNAARRVVFLVAGAEKRLALRRVLDGEMVLPAAWIRGGETLFLVTEETLGPGIKDFRGDARFA